MTDLPKIAIAGFGAEGQASYRYFKDKADVTIVDERETLIDVPAGVKTKTGPGSFAHLEGFDTVIRSPGIAPDKIKTDGRIWSATNEFFAHCPAPIIGVTGTKGKGTTSSLIASILRAAGKTVHLVGNIGEPALDQLALVGAEDLVVYELSSFQLWDSEKSPHVAVVLMIEPDHLDVHANLEDYIHAKAKITQYQTTIDRVVYKADNEWSSQIAAGSVGQRLAYPTERTAHVRGEYFYYQDTEVCAVDQLQLMGPHNIENACAAITAVWPWVQDGAVIAEGLRSFSGLPHRLKFVRQAAGVTYYDDSIATTPGSAIAALQAFSQPKVLILGGHDKGADLSAVIELCAATETQVVAVGGLSESIAQLCEKQDVNCVVENGSMSAVVAAATAVSQPGGVVLLSPAAASFDQYKNYQDRGDQFIAAVEQL